MDFFEQQMICKYDSAKKTFTFGVQTEVGAASCRECGKKKHFSCCSTRSEFAVVQEVFRCEGWPAMAV